MKKLVAYYSRADENYFGGTKKYIEVGNTEKAAKMIADMIGADLYKIKQIYIPIQLIMIHVLKKQKMI